MSEHFIQEYNGVKIYYNELADKFFTELIDGGSRYGKRSSLAELKELIDKNAAKVEKIEFQPFEAFMEIGGKLKTITVSKIRADDGFQIVLEGKSQKLSSYEFSKVKVKNDVSENVEKEIIILNDRIKDLESQENEIKSERFELTKSLENADLQEILRNYNKA